MSPTGRPEGEYRSAEHEGTPVSGPGSAVNRLFAAIAGLPQRLLVALVSGYRLLLKPWLGNACRFEPTCSAYALQALQQHGAVVGATLSAGRILRCNPWCDGGCDPVPAQAPRLFTRLGLGEREPTLDKKKPT